MIDARYARVRLGALALNSAHLPIDLRNDTDEPQSPSTVNAIGGSTTLAIGGAIVFAAVACISGATLTAEGGLAASTVPSISVSLFAPHADAVRADSTTQSKWVEATRNSKTICNSMSDAKRVGASVAIRSANAARIASTISLISERVAFFGRDFLTRYDEAERRDNSYAFQSDNAERLHRSTVTRYDEAERRDKNYAFQSDPVTRQSTDFLFQWGKAQPRAVDLRIPWGYSDWAGWLVLPPKPPTPPVIPTANGRYVGINLACPVQPDSAHLPIQIGTVKCYHQYPRQRTYHVLNSASVVRLPDRAPIAASSISATIDADSFSWSISMDLLDAQSLALLTPTINGPREVEITINGWVWTALIDSRDSTAAFIANSRRVTGRSRAAYLATPYAPTRSRVVTEIRLAQQLAALELAGTGWALDWECLDWLVPAGAWTYSDLLTPIDAIRRIAANIGAIVQTHRTDDELSVRARYPVKPWDWDSYAPDHIVLPACTVSLGETFAGGERPNAVIVRGERYGLAARVIRAGSAGDKYTGSIVDALITTPAAAQARAIYELSRTGPIEQVSVEMPLFPNGAGPGLIEPGRVVLMSGPGEYRAVSLACTISAQRTGAQLKVRQTIAVERHLDYL